MNRFAGKFCAAVAVAAALTIGVGPAGAETGLPLEPAAEPAPIFVPQTGSAGAYNTFMCYLHTISAQAPCIYT